MKDFHEQKTMEEHRMIKKIGECSIQSEFSEKELEVCEILLNLGNLIAESESRSLSQEATESELGGGGTQLQPFTAVWGHKKILGGNTRRKPSTSAAFVRPALIPSKETTTSCPSQQVELVPPFDLNENPSSPPSQSKISHKRNRDDSMKEIKNRTSYHNKLLEFNEQGMKGGRRQQEFAVPSSSAGHNKLGSNSKGEPKNSDTTGLGALNHHGPVRILHSTKERMPTMGSYQSLQCARARAAEARRHRKMLMTKKSGLKKKL